jgi:peptidoglycan/LPS O-acetylase OafA/YrhL
MRVAPEGQGRIADIEVLRGVAILMVLAEHLPINLIYWHGGLMDFIWAYWHGASGVDLFFAVSGFVIARTLVPRLDAAADGHARLVTVIGFWLRRAWRLLPAAWLWLAIPVILSVAFNRFGSFRSVHANLAMALASGLNFADIYVGEILGKQEPGIDSSYWSLSLEEQFYLVFPFLCIFARRWLGWILFVLVVYSFTIDINHSAVWPMTRPGGLAMGVAIALLRAHPLSLLAEPKFLGSSSWLRFAVLALFVPAAGALVAGVMAPVGSFGWGMLNLVCGVLVFAASFNQDYILPRGVLQRVLMWVGARSYTYYLVHMTAYEAAHEIDFWFWPPTFTHTYGEMARLIGIAVPLLLIAGELTYQLVERPLRRYGATIAARFEAEHCEPLPA